MSKSSVRVLDLVTFFLDFVTFLFDLVTDLVTFPLDLVTFPSPNRDDKFLCLVIIHKRGIYIFIKCTSDAAAHTCVWQQVYGIIEKEHIARHGSSSLYVINSESVRQCTRTVNLNTIVENENANRGFHVQRAMYKAVYSELNQACVRYFQLSHTVEFISYLHVMQITSEEIHDSVILMKQISLHICIIHLVTEYLTADAVACKTDALGSHHRHPALGVFAKQKHGSNSQCTIRTDKSQVAKYLLTVMSLSYGRAYHIK